MPLAPGQLFAGDFRIERELSRGGMGQVYVATQLSTGRERALKVMRPELVADPSLRKRFEQEARVGANIKSDHVVEVVAAGIDEATRMPWLAMELLEGESLAEAIERTDGMSPESARAPLEQLAHALTAAHAAGVIHRDLKPDNVFVAKARRASESSTVKVLDFGIAKVVAEVRATATAPIGTLLWMAPEQADADGTIGPATDVWAFGLIVFAVIVGRPFWDEWATVPVLLKKLTVDPIPSATARATELGRKARVPLRFDAWFAKCVARAPGDRFASIADAHAELDRVLRAATLSLAATEPLAVAPASTATPPARSKGRAITALAIAAGVAAAAVVSTRRPSATIATSSAVATSSSAAVAPSAAPSSSATRLGPDDEDDHDTVYRVPLGDSPRRGAAQPLVVLVEFAEFQCPYARGFEDKAKQIIEAYPDDVAIVWKDLPLDFHPVAEPAARLARLARAELGDAGFWKAHDRLFSACTNNDREELVRVGRELGLATAKVRAALEGPTPDPIERDCALALDLGDLGTPSQFINGRRLIGNQPFDYFKILIDQEIAKAKALIASGVARERVYDELQKGAKAIQPMEREHHDFPTNAAVRVGAHPIVDVHQLGDEANVFAGLSQPVVDYVMREYGDRIRFYWHAVPDPESATATHVAAFSDAIFGQSGNDVFWKVHKTLLDNQTWPFPDPNHKNPRGFGEDALADYARAAGANTLYLHDAIERPNRERWGAMWKYLGDHHRTLTGTLYVDGFLFGWNRRGAKRVIDQVIAEKTAK